MSLWKFILRLHFEHLSLRLGFGTGLPPAQRLWTSTSHCHSSAQAQRPYQGHPQASLEVTASKGRALDGRCSSMGVLYINALTLTI